MNFLFPDSHYLVDAFNQQLTTNPGDHIEIAQEAVNCISSTLRTAPDEVLAAISDRGRGAEFTAVNIAELDDDLLRLHLYPQFTRDGEYHTHARRVISTVVDGGLENDVASVDFCDPEDGTLGVWDCTRASDVCVPKLVPTLGARFSQAAVTPVVQGETYEVVPGDYHRVVVEAGTLTMCWFARTGMTTLKSDESRIIKTAGVDLLPVPSLTRADLTDLRNALDH